ncbi:MAG: phosphoribosylformylglycinamidine cyclo-ligase, partial [Thermoleophilia bacterium]|nr:phosphoribosylformylglycinamidine cyclo-ligase [Thermoleophilia bacterium]
CVNDVITTGARPLFFLDYFGTGKLALGVGEAVIKGIAGACAESGCALLGGETAELPGMYADGEYDLAGFAVGVVSKPRIVDGRRVVVGDRLLALASSGLHSNGYSLARRLLDEPRHVEVLLRPTRIYVRALRALRDAGLSVHAAAHITGGGIVENLPRVLPDGCGAVVEVDSWERPAEFDELVERGGLDRHAAHRTFNMGIGMVLAVPAESVERTLAVLGEQGDRAWLVGTVEAGVAGVDLVGGDT